MRPQWTQRGRRLFISGRDVFTNEPVTEYDLVLAARGDTRRLWAEHFLDVEQPRKSAERWAMRDALASVLAGQIATEQHDGAPPLDMRQCGVAPTNSRYAEIVRTALKAEQTNIKSQWFYRGTQVDIAALRGIKPNHVDSEHFTMRAGISRTTVRWHAAG